MAKIRLKYFPLCTEDLKSTEEIAFNSILKGFLEMIKISQKLELIEIIFSILREKHSIFQKRIAKFLENMFENAFKNLKSEEQILIIKWTISQFLDESLDDSQKNNTREAIIYKILLPLLEKISNNQVVIDFTVKYAPILLDNIKKFDLEKYSYEME